MDQIKSSKLPLHSEEDEEKNKEHSENFKYENQSAVWKHFSNDFF